MNYPTIISNTIIPKHKRPKHHKPDIIRATWYSINRRSTLVADPTYKGRRDLQLIEFKYSTYINISDIIEHIHTIYTPLK